MDTQNENRDATPAMGIKDKYLEQLHSDFQLLSEIVLTQISLAASLLHDNLREDVLLELKRNEKIINSLDTTIKEKVINAIMLFTPRASDLRRLMAYHDMTISMERVGDLIENISGLLQEIDFSLSGLKTTKSCWIKCLCRPIRCLKMRCFLSPAKVTRWHMKPSIWMIKWTSWIRR